MKLKFITINVKCLEESVEFYKEVLGFTEVKRFSPYEGTNIVFLSNQDKAMIELIEQENESNDYQRYGTQRVSLGFEVDDIEAIVDMLKNKKIEILRGPVQFPSGEKAIFLVDPNGVEIEFICEK